ncbi:MAG: hypothetical protein IT485_03325 [Gammaproteobacteria bacterium]|nr:hypothetical protein [Gammaproteobacteria bacterium]QOJ32136.1 MAG: hypothetical protein HRU81_08525 [Gammaproteobacteria bacterium]
MKTGIAFRATVPGRGAMVPLLALLASVATAGEPPVLHDFDTRLAASHVVAPLEMGGGLGAHGLASAVMPGSELSDDAEAAAPAAELAAGLDLQVDRNRRKFRTRAIDWVMDQSVAAGYLADFLVGGADSGWHFTMDPRGDDEYSLQWKVKFR